MDDGGGGLDGWLPVGFGMSGKRAGGRKYGERHHSLMCGKCRASNTIVRMPLSFERGFCLSQLWFIVAYPGATDVVALLELLGKSAIHIVSIASHTIVYADIISFMHGRVRSGKSFGGYSVSCLSTDLYRISSSKRSAK